MKTEVYNLISIFLQFFIAAGAIIFGIWQIKINDRLKKLQDFVAVSLVPENNPLGIKIMNVGKINLYLKKAELGNLVHNFSHSRLVSIGTDPFYFIAISNVIPKKQLSIKLYLFDELGKKYLTQGAAIVDQQQVSIPSQQDQNPNLPTAVQNSTQEFVTVFRIRSWTYATKKYNWKI